MNGYSEGQDPGYTTVIESGEAAFIWSAYHGEKNLLVKFGTISSTASDSSNTPTTTLRAGLILAIKDSDGFYYKYDPTATDGTQIAQAVLGRQFDCLGALGVQVAKSIPLIARANLLVNQLINYDAAAGKRLIQLGFILDAPAGAEVGESVIGWYEKAADYTVVAADNGKGFFQTTGAVNFTLPTKAVGLAFEFMATTAAATAILSAGSADDIIADGDAGADSVTFGTSSHIIGSRARVECRYLGGALKWIVHNKGGTLETVA